MDAAVYEIMHRERCVAAVSASGYAEVYDEAFLPYDLYLEPDTDDLDERLNNRANFEHWCASRVLSLDRRYAKEILNSIGAAQASTDRDRAQIALSYRCLCLYDVYWTRLRGDTATFAEVNLYTNSLHSAFVDLSLRGKSMTVQNSSLIAGDLSADGCFPKAWVRYGGSFLLYKGGEASDVKRELLASRICRCFDCRQVLYEPLLYDGRLVSVSRLIASVEYSLVPFQAYEIYAANHEMDALASILALDAHGYYMMNILDYLTGNTDRHWGNWGLLVDNRTNRPVRLYDLMDFNQAFKAYGTLSGANCLTTPTGRRLTQRQAAEEAARAVGLNQLAPVEDEWFEGYAGRRKMFWRRYRVLEQAAQNDRFKG